MGRNFVEQGDSCRRVLIHVLEYREYHLQGLHCLPAAFWMPVRISGRVPNTEPSLSVSRILPIFESNRLAVKVIEAFWVREDLGVKSMYGGKNCLLLVVAMICIGHHISLDCDKIAIHDGERLLVRAWR
jgi:hypothetical protein